MKKDIQKKLEQLSPEQRAILEKKLMEKSAQKQKILSIPQRENTDEYPMSFAQERLWFLHQLNPESAFYNMPATVKITGKFDPLLLEESINKVIERHEILRTVYDFETTPKQQVLVDVKLSINNIKIEDIAGENEEDKIEKFTLAEGSKPFDLSNEIPVRASVITLNPEKHILIVTFHHIAADGWSLAVFMNEVISVYKTLESKEEINLPQMKIQYADFAQWQKENFEKGKFSEQLKFWKKQLKNINSKLNLPIDKPYTEKQTFNGLHKTFLIEKELSNKIKDFVKERKTTLFVVLLSAFKSLLFRYTNQEDLTVGVPIAYRDKPELQNLIGFFINTLVFRTNFSDDPNFNDLVKQVHSFSIEAFANKDVPFEKVVESLKVKRSQESSPLFQTLFVMQNIPKKEIVTESLKFEFGEVETKNVKFDITLSIEESPDGFTGLLGYNTDLFFEETIDDFIKRYKIILKNAVENPTVPISELKLLDAEEERKYINEIISPEIETDGNLTLQEMFEKTVSLYPDKTALEYVEYSEDGEFEKHSLTYIELNTEANKLAHYLIDNGITAESIVAISFNKSPEMIIAILGVLKSGAAYLPVDPNYPGKRKLYMLEDSGAELLLVSNDTQDGYAEYSGNIVNISKILSGDSKALNEKNPGIKIFNENLAYIIYTSGSTGNPKGVAVSHKSVVNYILNTYNEYGFSKSDRFLQFASISFDAAAEEIFHAFNIGATLILRPEAVISSPKLFFDFVRELNISVLDLPTAYWHQLVPEIVSGETSLPASLRIVIIGGEKADAIKTAQWLKVIGGKVRLINTYGPTETTIVSLFHLLNNTDIECAKFKEIPIGKPVKGLNAFILDKALNPVPYKFPGELCISGTGLARGYLNKPDITAKVFLPDKFSNKHGGRIYRTGDRVRMQTDKSIEYIDRIDSQVKIRGFRIELSEIKNILTQHKGIEDAIVLPKKNNDGQNSLVAFYIKSRDVKLNGSNLREYLANKLPGYMIPSKFIELVEFPLTQHGKIDKVELLAISDKSSEDKKAHKKPANHLEEVLLQMWKEVLETNEIGTDCNFFEYGGDSLKAAVFINTLQKKLGKVVWVVSLFDNQTIEEYAQYLVANYFESLPKLLGENSEFIKTISVRKSGNRKASIGEEKIRLMREKIKAKSYLKQDARILPKKKGSKAVFILSAPRSGSTLLRVMLAGHQKLFAPPELALLLFENLKDRKRAFAGRDKGWSEGLTRGIMQIYNCDYLKAEEIIGEFEKSGMSIQELYYKLDEMIGDKILVDKTTTYATNLEVLKRAELYFDEVKYIHITRHPSAMIQSYLNSKLNEVFSVDNSFSERENAELFWIINNQNILEFFKDIPEERRYTLKFENLVVNPKQCMKNISGFLGIQFQENMIYPYADKKLRMTDGIHPESHMVGDPKFHEHKQIEANIAYKWQKLPENDYLSNEAVKLAESLKYYISNKDLLEDTSHLINKNIELKFEKYLIQKWEEILGVKSISAGDDFFELGGNEKKAQQFIDLLNKEFNLHIPSKALNFAPTILKFITYAYEYFPEKVRAYFDHVTNQNLIDKKFQFSTKKITDNDINEFEKIIMPVPVTKQQNKLPQAIFILSPPRSGSTLLRVMMAGNENLFAPPELDLLSYTDLRERKEALSGNYSLWLESLIRVVMELKNCSAEEAEEIINRFESQNLGVKEFYEIIQNWLGERKLVDKTPSYSLDINILNRMENWFTDAKYIHLVRNPYASVYSFLEANLDQNFFRYAHNFGRRELAEMIWTVSHKNILNFLKNIPGKRQFLVKFEDLVLNPDIQMRKICEFLEIEYNEEMIKPYHGNKMTEPVKETSQMVGDFKFYLHNNINPKVIDRWKKYHKNDFLNDKAVDISKYFGYGEEDLHVKENLLEIQEINDHREISLSFAQQRLWFLEQLNPGRPTYNIPGTVRIKGKLLDIDLFLQSIDILVKRHHSLRTVFPSAEGRPKQVVLDKYEIDFNFKNLNDLDNNIKNSMTKEIILKEALKPFDLAKGPLVRFRLIQTRDEEYYFLSCMHHIITDGWSIQIFVRELISVYDNLSKGKEIDLEPLSIQYTDFSEWQREWMQSDAYFRQLEYWKTKLAGAPSLLELPTDFPRKPLQTQEGSRLRFAIDYNSFNKIKTFGSETKSTPFVIMLTVFKILLSKYARNNDILVGTPVAGRTRKELENIIGFFVNTLVLRTLIEPDKTAIQIIEEIKRNTFEALSNQEIPFEKLVDELNVERSLSHSPLFQVMFVYNQSVLQKIESDEFVVEPVPVDLKTAKFDITFVLTEFENRIQCDFEYNTSLFNEDTIERMIEHFKNLLNLLLDNPRLKVSEIELVSNYEKQKLLNEWNNTEVEFPNNKTIHELFSEKVKENPERIAVEWNGNKITYGELDKYSNAVANYLISKNIGHDDIVGVYMYPSTDTIAVLMGILKSGAAYLPLDPEYPEKRISYMLDDSKVKVVFVQNELQNKISKEGIELLTVDFNNDSSVFTDFTKPELKLYPENLAYVIYTSGSTGKPKGVMQTHKGLINHVHDSDRRKPVRESVCSLWTSLNFDVSVYEIFYPLIFGNELHIVPQEIRAINDQLFSWLGEHKVVSGYLPPFVLDEYDKWLENHREDSYLQKLLVGVEPIKLKTLSGIYDKVPEILILNGYGPTETTICSTIYEIKEKIFTDEITPIGRAMSNTRIFILDENMNLSPIGVPGEVYIESIGEARGYLNRPDLTAERFIPNPFSKNGGERLYKTGDLAFYKPDGNIKFVGRVDNQIKFKGFRIELGEIEENIKKHPSVNDAAVIIREDKPGIKKLVGYFSVVKDKNTDGAELRNFLSEILPDYMIPSVFVKLDELPKTPNGKIDRRNLPVPTEDDLVLSSEFVEAESKTEKILLEIWKEVLQVNKIGVLDNFFELGGDSILGIQVIAKANAAGLKLSPKNLFEAPTILGLANLANKAKKVVAEQGLISGEVPLTPIQRWFFEQNFKNPNHWNQSILLEVSGKINTELFAKAVKEIMKHHDVLRLRYVKDTNGYRQIFSEMNSHVPFVVEDLSAIESGKISAIITEKSNVYQSSLNIKKGPLFKIVYFKLNEEENDRLLIIIHHLVIDGVSWRIILEDLQTAYELLKRELEVKLPEKTTSFKYWSEKLIKSANDNLWLDELEFWKNLSKNKEYYKIPADFEKGQNTEESKEKVVINIPAEKTEIVLQEVTRKLNTNMLELLLNAFGEALSRWDGKRKHIIGLEGHGREDIFDDVDISRTVGWFTSTYPVLIDLKDAPDVLGSLKYVKEQLRNIPHNGMGFGVLKYLSNNPEVREIMNNIPEPEIMFNYLGVFNREEEEKNKFKKAEESAGDERNPQNLRPNLMEVTGNIADGELILHINYSKNYHEPETIEKLANLFQENILQIIESVKSGAELDISAVDFEDADITDDDLDDLLMELDN